nr:RNA-directed DNA polymerase, eukaryota [Tanacetum cinerariifolium]
WVADFVEDIEEESDSDDDSYEGEIKSDGLKFLTASDVEVVPKSKFKEDPKKHTDTNKKDANLKDSLKLPPGFTPRDDVGAAKENSHVQLEKTKERVDQEVGASVEKQTILNNKGVNDVEESICSGHFRKSEVPYTGGSIIQLMDDLLRYLKDKIQMWSRLIKESSNSRKRRRPEVVRLLQDVEKIESLEVAQKAKIKWAIEGDENSKYYHGVLNKKEDSLLFVVFWLMVYGLNLRP